KSLRNIAFTLHRYLRLMAFIPLLITHIYQHGIRNSHITAIAANTSSFLVPGCTASVLPVYNKFFDEKGAKGSVPIAPPYIRDNLWFYVA
ncbi:MAG: ribonucleoside-diphosphate reductase subunit alpha, partial [Nostoc sp.]